ncbi:MAG: hypothetical protein ACYDGM_02910 [Vulcanimicrobiaceae bacterium]
MKQLFAALCIGAALTACGGGVGGGTSTPPSVTSVLIITTKGGAPMANQSVVLSTGVTGSLPNVTPTGVIATQTTNASGQTTFGGLTAGTYYCWTWTYQAGSLQQSTCMSGWGGLGSITLAI